MSKIPSSYFCHFCLGLIFVTTLFSVYSILMRRVDLSLLALSQDLLLVILISFVLENSCLPKLPKGNFVFAISLYLELPQAKNSL